MKDTRSMTTGVVLVLLLLVGGIAWYFSGIHSSALNTSTSLHSPQTFKIGQEKIIEGLSLKVSAVTEDSRCPEGVVCVWAGRVVATIVISADGQTKTGPINLNESVPFKDYAVTFTAVTPKKKQGAEIKPEDFSLTFTVQKIKDQSATAATKTYSNAQYGFSFSYPSSYFLETHDEAVSGRDHFTVVLTEDTADNQALRSGVGPARDGPVAITLEVFKDPIGNPTLLQWLKDTPGSNFNVINGTYKKTTFSGKDAISYHWSGLYEADTIALQNKGYTFAATVTYIAKADPIVAIYNDLIKTITFK